MWQAIVDGAMPDYWPPRPSRLWNAVFGPFRRWLSAAALLLSYRRRIHRGGLDKIRGRLGPADGVLIAPIIATTATRTYSWR